MEPRGAPAHGPERHGDHGAGHRPRVGLVLGAGGVAGGAFHAGVLAALADATGWDPRTAEVIVGTSAGSVTAVGLRAGLSAPDLRARAEGRPLSAEGQRVLRRAGPPVSPPPLRAERGGSRSASEISELLRQAARRPLSTRPTAILAALLPDGVIDTGFITAGLGAFVGADWPSADTWICAVRQRDGRRVVFGRDARPPVPEAVAASCAIPRVFRPVVIDDEAYVDGGAHSPTNADVLLPRPLDLVVVSSPMSAAGRGVRLTLDQPARRWSRALLDAEALRLRRRGTEVVAFQPGPDDLAVMGLNAMDPSRRAPITRQAYQSARRRLDTTDLHERLRSLLATQGGAGG